MNIVNQIIKAAQEDLRIKKSNVINGMWFNCCILMLYTNKYFCFLRKKF